MLDAAANIITGPLGGLLAAIAAVVGALAWGRRTGAQNERQKRAGHDAEAYAKERKRQDEIDIGHGATDDERIRRLRAIADGRSGSDT